MANKKQPPIPKRIRSWIRGANGVKFARWDFDDTTARKGKEKKVTPETKTIHNHRAKLDGEETARCDSVSLGEDGKVESLVVYAPSQETYDGKFGPDKLAQANDPVLKEGECEVEVLFLEKGWNSVWKGTAERKFDNGTEGGKRLSAKVRLDSFDPPLIWDEEAKRLRGE